MKFDELKDIFYKVQMTGLSIVCDALQGMSAEEFEKIPTIKVSKDQFDFVEQQGVIINTVHGKDVYLLFTVIVKLIY